MAETYLRVSLGVQPTQGGAAELVPPPELAGVDFRYVVVKEGGEEGIVVVDGEPSLIARLQTAPAITKLTAGRLAAVRDGYPPPRLKQRYRLQTAAPVEEALSSPYATDGEGKRVVDTLQTVRSGFYLIDVPVTPP